ncbi:MAG: ADP-ribosylation factor-like protein [Candidatus Thorarchaeota archaeon]
MSYLDKISSKEKEHNGKKILLLGLTQSGKTSIIKTFFEGMTPEDTESLDATIKFESNSYGFNDHKIQVYDVGGQIVYLEEAIEKNKERIFTDVKSLIFVIELPNMSTYELSRQYLLRILKNVYLYSDNPETYVFAHKIDLISKEYRDEAVRVFKKYFAIEEVKKIKVFQTSIYESTSKKALKEILEN